MTLIDCISKIVEKFGTQGKYFDSHTVINEMIKDREYHKSYLEGYRESNSDISLYHGYIAKRIGEVKGVRPVTINDDVVKCVSHTIYGDLSVNQLWKLESDGASLK